MDTNATGSPGPELPRRDPLYVVLPVTIIYVIIFVTGVAGNVVTVMVISHYRSMHTATNYYLRSLAVSDLLLLLAGLPQEVYSIWVRYPYAFGEAFCVLRGVAAETSANASVLTITAFTVERYLAICRPLMTVTKALTRRAARIIAVTWIVALLCAFLQALQFGLMHKDNPELVACVQVRVILEHSFEVSTIIFFVAPVTLISVLYALIGIRLHALRTLRARGLVPGVVAGPGAAAAVAAAAPRASAGAGAGTGASAGTGVSAGVRRVAANGRVIRMLVAVVLAFFVCWAPFHAQRLMAIHGGGHIWDGEGSPGLRLQRIFDFLTYVSGVLHYVSATVNPILYNIMSRRFRGACKDTLARLFPHTDWARRRGRGRGGHGVGRPWRHRGAGGAGGVGGMDCGGGGGGTSGAGLVRLPAFYRRHNARPNTAAPLPSDDDSPSCSDDGEGVEQPQPGWCRSSEPLPLQLQTPHHTLHTLHVPPLL